jgi:hypothetical protein
VSRVRGKAAVPLSGTVPAFRALPRRERRDHLLARTLPLSPSSQATGRAAPSGLFLPSCRRMQSGPSPSGRSPGPRASRRRWCSAADTHRRLADDLAAPASRAGGEVLRRQRAVGEDGGAGPGGRRTGFALPISRPRRGGLDLRSRRATVRTGRRWRTAAAPPRSAATSARDRKVSPRRARRPRCAVALWRRARADAPGAPAAPPRRRRQRRGSRKRATECGWRMKPKERSGSGAA